MNRREAFATAIGIDYAETEDFEYQNKAGVPTVYSTEPMMTVATEGELVKIQAKFSHLEALGKKWVKTDDRYQQEVVAAAHPKWFLWKLID